MKFMKLGTRPDTFYTEEATRTVLSDVPSCLTIKINNITYLLHKYPLLPKCGLLQRLYSSESSEDSSGSVTLELHDIPGGEEAFELCAKYCYGITINLSASNVVPAFCAAKFLRMTEAVEAGNFAMKLEVFFSSCILEGWKDAIVALQKAESVYEWSENLGIVRRCIESIVDKILTPTSKVSWSYTYTRPGYDRKRRQTVPKDWWTEDISFLDIDMFRCIVAAIKSTNALPPPLIGEALHVYACRWLLNGPDQPSSSSSQQNDTSPEKKRRILETIVALIPAEKGSVLIRFLLRLLGCAGVLLVSPVTKAELLRLSGLQLEEATLDDLMLFARSPEEEQALYDVDLVRNVVESFLRQWKRQVRLDEGEGVRRVRKVGKIVDSYLRVVAKVPNMPVKKVASLAEALPGVARPDHDDLYKAINAYLKEHPELSKAEKKQLCRVLDCQKLSPEVRAHAVRNERLPLRTVVQVLFFEQEKANSITGENQTSADEQSYKPRDNRASAGTSGAREDKLQPRPEPDKGGETETSGLQEHGEVLRRKR